MVAVTLAVEDVVAESLVHKIIRERGIPLEVEQTLQMKGVTYLARRADSLNRAAHGGVKSILLADSDSSGCPVIIAKRWFPNGRHENLAFRFSVHEAESWLLADSHAFSIFFGVSGRRLPARPDELEDPKRTIVDLARRSRIANIRNTVVPQPGSVVPVGVGYNFMMLQFISRAWSAARAVAVSPSLESFERRIVRLAAA